MSMVALRWAFAMPLSGPKKAVLLALADHADDDGFCWPSIDRLVLFSGVQERTARYAIRELTTTGLLTFQQSNGRTANRYHLALDLAPDAGLNVAKVVRQRKQSCPANPAPRAATLHHVQQPNPAPDAPNPAPDAPNPAPDAPEPPRTPIEPPKEPPMLVDIGDPVRDAVAVWNEVCGSLLPKVRDITQPRRKAMAGRLKDTFKTPGMWRRYCETIAGSEKLTGGIPGWAATFDWATKPSSVTKVLEGNYANRTQVKPPSDPWAAWIDPAPTAEPVTIDMEFDL